MRIRFESLRVRDSSIFESEWCLYSKHQGNISRFKSLRVRDSSTCDNEEDTDTEGDEHHEM